MACISNGAKVIRLVQIVAGRHNRSEQLHQRAHLQPHMTFDEIRRIQYQNTKSTSLLSTYDHGATYRIQGQ